VGDIVNLTPVVITNGLNESSVSRMDSNAGVITNDRAGRDPA